MENNKTIKKIDMELLEGSGKATYADGDIVIFDSVHDDKVYNIVQLDFVMICHCAKGRIQLNINDKEYTASEGDFIICPPNTILDKVMISPDFQSRFIGLSHSAIQHSLHISKNMWNMILYIAKNPVIHQPTDRQQLFIKYYDLLSIKLNQAQHPYYKEVMQSLLQSIFYELCSIIQPHIIEPTLNSGLRQGTLLFKRFLKLLSQSDGRERSVSKFADELCVTPKYLSTVTKIASGKTALQWIHEHVTETISRQLRYSDKSIKEIADELNFPNLSFFGKFVRIHLGMSPTEYRKHLDESEK